MKVITHDSKNIDGLIARHPSFIASIKRARQQKVAGQVFSLAEVRQKYSTDNDD